MRLACSTAVFADRPLEAALEAISALGFHHVDLLGVEGWNHFSPRELAEGYNIVAADVETDLALAGLEAVAFNVGLSIAPHHRSRIQRIRANAETDAIARLMQRFGVTAAAVQPYAPDPDRPRDEQIADAAASLRTMNEIGSEYDAVFALECHSGSLFESMEAIAALISLEPGVRFAWDPSHFVMMGIPLESTLPALDRAATVHLRDAAPGVMHAQCGAGTLDLGWVRARLAERGYAGPVSIEALPSGAFDAGADALAIRRALEG